MTQQPICKEVLGRDLFKAIKGINRDVLVDTTKEDLNKAMKIAHTITQKHLEIAGNYSHFEHAEETLEQLAETIQQFIDIKTREDFIPCLGITEKADIENFYEVYEQDDFDTNCEGLANAILETFYTVMDVCGIELEVDPEDLE